jgi:hypothetical protein
MARRELFIVGSILARIIDPPAPDCTSKLVVSKFILPSPAVLAISCDACVAARGGEVWRVRHRDSNLECSASHRVPTFAVEPDVVYAVSQRAPTVWRVHEWQLTTARRGDVVLSRI